MFKNYIFDLYGTLVDIHTNENKKYLWDKLSLYYNFNGASYTSLELKRDYKKYCKQEEDKMSDIDFPEINLTKVFQRLYQEKSVNADLELAIQTGKIFRTLSIEYIGLYDGVIKLLEELKQSGKKIYLLSNAQQMFTEPEMKMLHIYDYFDGIFFSSDLGYQKPSPLFYEALLQRYQLDKKESIMIGNDAIADIKGANGAGLTSLYIHSNLSPDFDEELKSEYTIMDGDIYKIQKMILK